VEEQRKHSEQILAGQLVLAEIVGIQEKELGVVVG
jgi:hypothetical protein